MSSFHQLDLISSIHATLLKILVLAMDSTTSKRFSQRLTQLVAINQTTSSVTSSVKNLLKLDTLSNWHSHYFHIKITTSACASQLIWLSVFNYQTLRQSSLRLLELRFYQDYWSVCKETRVSQFPRRYLNYLTVLCFNLALKLVQEMYVKLQQWCATNHQTSK